MVEEFVLQREQGREPDLDELCADLPPAQARELRRRCSLYLDLDGMSRRERLLAASRRERLPDTFPGLLLLQELGQGGTGRVFLAWQESLGRMVALKILPRSLAGSEEEVRRFRAEAEAAARLQHPGIVQVHQVGEHEGSLFIVQEYVDGRTLRAELDAHREDLRRLQAQGLTPDRARRRLAGAPGAPRRAADRARALALALEHAHARGVLHGDLKPENVVLGWDGSVKLLDFGLLRALATAGGSPGRLATSRYLAPERRRRGAMDERSDVFGLGVLLYEMLTLEHPFPGTGERAHRQAVALPRGRVPTIPRDLEAICCKALELDPARRYPSAGALAEDLQRFLDGEAVAARPLTTSRRLLRVLRHNVALLLVMAGLAGLGLVALDAWRESTAESILRPQFAALAPLLEPDPGQASPGQLLAARHALALLESQAETLPAARREELAVARKALALLAERRKERLLAGLATLFPGRRGSAAPAPPASDEGRGVDPGATASLFLELAELATLVPEDPELRELLAAQPWANTLAVHSLPEEGAAVRLLRLDPLTGQPEAGPDGRPRPPLDLGTTPVEHVVLDPGFYRIVLEKPGLGRAEVTRLLAGFGEELELRPVLRGDADATRDMRWIPGGRLSFRPHAGAQGPVAVEVPDFWLDTHEVSNGEYEAFLVATGRPEPDFWLAPGERPPGWAELPVVGVTLEDARAYAEWAGKRLPSLVEWEWAARGPEHRRFPWGEEAALAARANVRPGLETLRAATDRRAFQDAYLAGVQPVAGADPATWTPEGLQHLFGNVAEMTDTPLVEQLGGRPQTVPYTYFAMGEAWCPNSYAAALRFGLDHVQVMESFRSDVGVGFRCARSAAANP